MAPVRDLYSNSSTSEEDGLNNIPISSEQLPRLPINLSEHKLAIAIQWGGILATSCVAPLVLYPALYYSAKLPLNTALGVAGAVLGVATVFSLILRTWKLAKSSSACRPPGGSRWGFDFFHWNYLLVFLGVTVLLVVGLMKKPPSIQLVSLPPSVVMVFVSALCVVTGILSAARVRVPIRMSSVPAGEICPPAILPIIEDIVAVDGGVGVEYRHALMARYNTSSQFRGLIHQLNWFWGLGGVLVGAGLIGGMLASKNDNLTYGMGWLLPWVWAAIWTITTIFWVKRALAQERKAWNKYPQV